MATRARHRRLLFRLTAAAIALGVVGAAGVLSATALRGRRTNPTPVGVGARRAPPSAPAPTPAEATVQAPAAATENVADSLRDAPRPGMNPPNSPALAPSPSRTSLNPAPMAPLVAEGTTRFGDGVFAMRAGNTVTVHFDLSATRTRRPERFEEIVRATLPRIYGAAADSLLSTVTAGSLTSTGDLLVDLPARGIRLKLPAGGSLALWPETRPGRDGPLVVSYRVTVSR